MPQNATLSDLRNALDDINRAILRERGDGEVSSKDAISRLKEQHKVMLKTLSPQLIDIALNKLHNEVGSRKGPKAMTNEGYDLFGTYHGIPKMITLIKGKKKDTAKATFVEADLWLKAHERPDEEGVIKNEDFKRLVDECRPYAESADDTLEMAMKRKMDVEGKGALDV